jgi:hypothetical protein
MRGNGPARFSTATAGSPVEAPGATGLGRVACDGASTEAFGGGSERGPRRGGIIAVGTPLDGVSSDDAADAVIVPGWTGAGAGTGTGTDGITALGTGCKPSRPIRAGTAGAGGVTAPGETGCEPSRNDPVGRLVAPDGITAPSETDCEPSRASRGTPATGVAVGVLGTAGE